MLSASQWVWDSLAALTLMGLAIPALWLQYRGRRTLVSRGLMLVTLATGAAAYVFLPWPVAASVQTRLSSGGFPEDGLVVKLKPDAGRFFSRGTMWRGGVQVDIPLAVSGPSGDVEIAPDAITLAFETSDGSRWSTGPYRYPALAKQLPGPGPAVMNANIDVPIEFHTRAMGATRQGDRVAVCHAVRQRPVGHDSGAGSTGGGAERAAVRHRTVRPGWPVMRRSAGRGNWCTRSSQIRG